MKIIIDDPLARMKGKKETELSNETTIRFEIGTTKLTCYMTKEGLRMYKMIDLGSDIIEINPIARNAILIR